MSLKLMSALAAGLLILAGCAQTESYKAPEKGDEGFFTGRDTKADEVYVNPANAEGGNAFREVYIAPANLSRIQIIQPEGADPDTEWQISDLEDGILQNAIRKEFSIALGYESAFNVVQTREEADMVIKTTVVAIHPNATREEIAAGARRGGAITVSMALVNAETGAVMIRSVDTKSTDDIWAFNQVENETEAVNLIFRAWGNSMRRGLLHLQGRSRDPLAEPLQLKPQQ